MLPSLHDDPCDPIASSFRGIRSRIFGFPVSNFATTSRVSTSHARIAGLPDAGVPDWAAAGLAAARPATSDNDVITRIEGLLSLRSNARSNDKLGHTFADAWTAPQKTDRTASCQSSTPSCDGWPPAT